MTITLRPARPRDVRAIEALVAPLAAQKILLAKESVAYYEAIQEFTVAESDDGTVVGCGALHVMWEDLAEVRTLAVAQEVLGAGVGHALLDELLERARSLQVDRVFCLTFEVAFFERHGFRSLGDGGIDPEVYMQLLRSQDEGVAEFLDLARVKPNTLGNTRMIRHL